MNFDFNVTGDGLLSLLGSLLSFAGIFITIKHTKKQSEKDKRISIKPYIDIKLKRRHTSASSFGVFTIGKSNKNFKMPDGIDIGLEFTNLGQGNCLECKLVKIIIDGKNVNDEYGYIGNLKVDEKILRQITFIIWYENILEELKKEYIGKNINDCPKEFEQFTYNHLLKEVELQFEYKDVLDNKYRKTIVIEIFIEFDILAEKYIWEISDIKFNNIYSEINGNLISEDIIKLEKKP